MTTMVAYRETSRLLQENIYLYIQCPTCDCCVAVVLLPCAAHVSPLECRPVVVVRGDGHVGALQHKARGLCEVPHLIQQQKSVHQGR